MVKDHYAALGIAPDADQEVIKAAFRALAKKYHPDTAADPGGVSRDSQGAFSRDKRGARCVEQSCGSRRVRPAVGTQRKKTLCQQLERTR